MNKKTETLDDAGRLAALFGRLKARQGPSKAKFASKHKVPGGPSMLSQHLSGHRPISQDAAIAYARGFTAEGLGCTIADISPQLAADLARANMVGTHKAAEPEPKYMPTVIDKRGHRIIWPFEAFTPQIADKLTADKIRDIEQVILLMLKDAQIPKQKQPAKKTGRS
jgi:hypothetical protein